MSSSYPIRLRGRLDPEQSRALWLVKWLLLIPHAVVLVFLWIAFVLLTFVAFVAIVLSGRYPRTIFAFNVGVLRWTWRVAFYGYGALGTDRYPPFTLDEVPDYPATLEVDYPEQLSRGLPLVKSWLLALPHYLVLAFFVGGGLHLLGREGAGDGAWNGGLIALLTLIAGVVLAFTGAYPQPLFDLILGLDRWLFRVIGYATLMTDEYPPFRLDLGGEDHEEPDAPLPPLATNDSGAPWTAGRVVAVVTGGIAILLAILTGIGGAGLALVHTGVRDDQDFVMSAAQRFDTTTYAISTTNVQLHGDGGASSLPRRLLGRVKITAEAPDGAGVFVGIGRSERVDDYLAGVSHVVVQDLDRRSGDLVPRYRNVEGQAPTRPPGEADVWTVQVAGTGEQTLVWPAESGDWTVVVMNADARPAVDVRVRAGATVPILGWAVAVLLTLAGVLMAVGVLLLVLGVRRPGRAQPVGPAREAAP